MAGPTQDGKLKVAQTPYSGAVKESFAKAPAADVTTILSKAADHNGAADDQPEYPCTIQAVLAGGGGTEDVTVVIDGLNAAGEVIQETLHPIFGALTKNGVKAFAKITNITASGTWDGATLTLKNRGILGFVERQIASVFKEVFDGADQSIGTFDAVNQLYTPTGALDGLKPLELWYKKL
jgi:hypothetical protein